MVTFPKPKPKPPDTRPRMKINSVWSMEKGRWDKETKQFTNRVTTQLPDRELEMVIDQGTHGNTIKFEGGPTGFESYYIEDLVRGFKQRPGFPTLCICAGTINSWPRCEVSVQRVQEFLKEHGYE